MMRSAATIPIVEDEPAIQELLADALHDECRATCSARDGIEALQRRETVRPEPILLDLCLPRTDGISFAADLRLRRPAVRAHRRAVRLEDAGAAGRERCAGEAVHTRSAVCESEAAARPAPTGAAPL
jgi:CheY-like chemotaxis protein